MSSGRVDLVVPGVFDRLSEWQADYAGLPTFAKLAGWWGRGVAEAIDGRGYEATLWRLLRGAIAADTELPVARALCDRAGATVCRADPAHLRADVSDLIVSGLTAAPLDAAEREAIANLVGAHVREYGGWFQLEADGAGYLGLPDALGLGTVPPSRAYGRAVRRNLPAASARRVLHGLLNEVQMLLHRAPFNAARALRGAPTANTLWVWGGGTEAVEASHDYAAIVADDALVAGLAARAAIPVDEWLARPAFPDGDTLIVWDRLLEPALYDDLNAWLEAMQIFETRLRPFLRQALARGAYRELRIIPCNGTLFRLRRWDRWLRWRAPNALNALGKPM
ncbi:MAG: hypothetical protein ACFCUJ_10015 [Thiotrichales bacterium]